MQDFSEIEAIITKQRLMETLIVRHNALAVQLPKELTPDNADEFRLIKREIDGNMIRI